MESEFLSDKIVVCLPTYNEGKNILRAIENIFNVIPNAKILVIDDNSPDGTGKIAQGMACKNHKIAVLHRPFKQGLGKAYLHGFRYILNNRSDIQMIIQMDADLSHPAVYIKDMLKAIKEADLVLGSRYVPGGKTENWGILRRVVSRFGSLYARAWLKIPVADLTGGYKLWRRNLLEQIINRQITTTGYAFQVETTYVAYLLDARIVETPITFSERNTGKSKMTLGIVFEAFWRIPLIFLKCNRLIKHTDR